MYYVYKCIKNQEKQFLGLGTDFTGRKYRIGDYITYDGSPTKSLDKAYIFIKDDYDIFDNDYDDGRCYRDYFKLVPVKIIEVP